MDPHHDVPPPPYSETDIYSHSQPGSPPSSVPLSYSRRADDAISSSTEDVQYTPPLTPITTRSVATEPRPAAAAFFDSRPPPSRTPPDRLEHTITINAETRPQDLAPRPEFAAHDVSEQDWTTFVNFILPDHAARNNEAVVERKLRVESDAGSSRGDAEAQLGSIRSDDGSQPRSAPPREDVERTVDEWNTFFFGPRGISIRLTSEPGARQMPGAWDESFDTNAGNTENGAANTNTNAAGESGNPFSWGLGGIRVTQDGISIGNHLEAHRHGVRVGQFSVDHSGITYGGRPLVPTLNSGHGGYYGAGCPGRAAQSQPRTAPTAPANANNCGSSSECDSESSDGDEMEEMLDYDELLDDDDGLSAEQYNVCSEALKRWINAPTQHITRADLRSLKGQMRALKVHHSSLPSVERKERKKELKALLKAVRRLVKQQKQERRQLRRQERQRKRAGQREIRQQQRDLRRLQRGHARGRYCPPSPSTIPTAPVTSASPAPPTTPGQARSTSVGHGCHFGAYQGRESFPRHMSPYEWPFKTGSAECGFHRGRYESFNRALRKLEERVVERTAALNRLENEMANNISPRGWTGRRMEGRKYALEKEIEALQVSMEGLQVQADYEYAKMAAEEGDAAKA